MPLTGEAKKEYQRKLMREKRSNAKGLTNEGLTAPGLTPPIIIALADPVKRKKLRAIAQSLNDHNVLKEVRYGVNGPTFDAVAELLTAL